MLNPRGLLSSVSKLQLRGKAISPILPLVSSQRKIPFLPFPKPDPTNFQSETPSTYGKRPEHTPDVAQPHQVKKSPLPPFHLGETTSISSPISRHSLSYERLSLPLIWPLSCLCFPETVPPITPTAFFLAAPSLLLPFSLLSFPHRLYFVLILPHLRLFSTVHPLHPVYVPFYYFSELWTFIDRSAVLAGRGLSTVVRWLTRYRYYCHHHHHQPSQGRVLVWGLRGRLDSGETLYPCRLGYGKLVREKWAALVES